MVALFVDSFLTTTLIPWGGHPLTPLMLISSKWPLVKSSIIAGSSFPTAVAVGHIFELVAGLIEQRERFRSALEGAGLVAKGSVSDLIPDQIEEQVVPQLPTHLLIARLGDGIAVLAERVDCSLKAYAFQIRRVTVHRFGDDAAD